ncbi:hypothetical protein JCM11251_006912 [Rhodosporidiobolus azoricus]
MSGRLSLADRKSFERDAQRAYLDGTFSDFLGGVEKSATEAETSRKAGVAATARDKLQWARSGVWNTSQQTKPTMEVFDFSSKEDIEGSLLKAGPSCSAARSPLRPVPEVIDLTESVGDEIPAGQNEGEGAEEDNASSLSSANFHQPQSLSPELFGEGFAPLPSLPTSASSLNGRRRSQRGPRQARFFGDLRPHPKYELGNTVYVSRSPPASNKRRKTDAGKSSTIKMKKEEILHKPIFLTPEVAKSVARLFPHTMFRSTLLAEEMQSANKADEAVLTRVKRNFISWQKAEETKKCVPTANSRMYILREGTKISASTVATYGMARVGDEVIKAGDFVTVAGDKDEPWYENLLFFSSVAGSLIRRPELRFGRVVYFHDYPTNSTSSSLEGQLPLQVHLHWASTARALYGKPAHPRHLLLREDCGSVSAYTIISKVDVMVGTDMTVPSVSLFLSSLHHADCSTSPVPSLDAPTPRCDRLGVRPCWACQDILEYTRLHDVDPTDKSAVPLPYWSSSSSSMIPSFRYDQLDYHIGDVVYLLPTKAAQEPSEWSAGTASFRLAVLEGVDGWDESDPDDPRPSLKPWSQLNVMPIVRLGHLRATTSGQRQERDLVITHETTNVRLDDLVGKFTLNFGKAPTLEPYEQPDTFWSCNALDELLDIATERAVLAVWSSPPRLLRPDPNLGLAFDALLRPLEEAELPTCEFCRRDRRHTVKDDARYGALIKDVAKRPTALSLFSGIDLFGLGLTAGCPELILQYAIELDEDAAEACRLNHIDTKVFTSDVAGMLEEAWGRRADETVNGILDVDVVLGGPPCQEFSRANLHKKRDDPRPLQPFVFLGFLESGRPSFALAENVTGMTTFKREEQGDVFGLVCEIALRLGYDVKPVVTNAASYGVPQYRRRLFLQFTKRGLPIPAAPEPTRAVSAKGTRLGIKYQDEADDTKKFTAVTRRAEVHSAPFPAITVGEALSDTSVFPSFDAYDCPVSAAQGFAVDGFSNHVAVGMSGKVEARVRSIGFHFNPGETGDWQDFSDDPTIALDKAPTWNSLKDSCWRRVWADEISAPLLTRMDPKGANGARIHFRDSRCWSVAECLSLQGAPIDLKLFPNAVKGKPLTKSDVETAYKLIGNAVAVPVAAAFGIELHKSLRQLVLDSKVPVSSTFFRDLSRSVDPIKPAKNSADVIVLDNGYDHEDEEMQNVAYDGAPSNDSQSPIEQLVDGEKGYKQVEACSAGSMDDVDMEEESSDEEVVVVSSSRKRKRRTE